MDEESVLRLVRKLPWDKDPPSASEYADPLGERVTAQPDKEGGGEEGTADVEVPVAPENADPRSTKVYRYNYRSFSSEIESSFLEEVM